jgi:hypothetical protein
MIKWHSSHDIPQKCSTRVILMLKSRMAGCVTNIVIACWEDCASDHSHDMAFVIQCPIVELGRVAWSSCERDSGCVDSDDIDGWIPFEELELVPDSKVSES